MRCIYCQNKIKLSILHHPVYFSQHTYTFNQYELRHQLWN